jgi:hypothetical protein
MENRDIPSMERLFIRMIGTAENAAARRGVRG